MKYFFLSLCLAVLWTSGSVVAGENVSTKVDIVQYPILVDVGESVTLTCNVTAERKIEDLKWTDSDRRELRKGDKGVVDLHELKLEELSASSVLKLSVKDKNGDEWPKNVTCKVELEPEKKGSPPVIYDATVVVNVTVSTKVNIAQYPNPVEVGESVKLTCNVTAERKIEDLKWTDSDRRELRQTDKGVVDLPKPTLRELSASSVLKLSVKDKNGDEWPKNVTCKVELEPENKGSHSEIYDASVVVNVTVSTKVNIAQYPNPVEVGKNVTLTCNVTAERKIEDLKWTDSDRRELRQTDKGVVDLPQPTLRELSASSVLKLSVKDKNGDEWPKNVTCKVELEPENKESHPEIYEIYDETVVVNVTAPLTTKPPAMNASTTESPTTNASTTEPPTTNASTTPSPTTKPVPTGAPVGTTVGIEQDPNPVQVGNNVTLTCNATAKREIKKLKWIVAEKEVDPNDEGVVHLWPSSLKNSNLTISSVLMLFVKKKNGDKWPKSVTCKVELKPEKGQSVLEYNRTLEVNVTELTMDAPPTQPTTNPTTTTTQIPKPTPSPTPGNSVGVAAIAVAVVVVVVICGVVFVVYWRRHTLREWLMEKDVVKVMKKGKRGKGYKYSKLPRDISTSMKHLE